ncbi:MAG: lytic transglycosylase domain-containing protein [Clostridia bacterium]|nr:lytic transglycosylase domain-containing protein [Clostridia bacterium]
MAKPKRIALLILAALVVTACFIAGAYFVDRIVQTKIYKLPYSREIQDNAKTYDLPPSLIAAVIHVESHNRPDAVSPKGAMGLMQIMPETGAWIYSKITGEEEADFKTRRLVDPETNIAFGCWYLRYLLDKYQGDTKLALIAYNAGPGNLDKWLADAEISPQGTLSRIPFAETERYVDKILQAREMYETLYEKDLS